MRTTPKLVAQNKNTPAAADPIAGASAGSVTDVNARAGEAPSDRAASVARRSSCDHSPATVRATTATLKKLSASTTANTPPSGSSVRNASPTTTVGSTNGPRSAPATSAGPGSEVRASRYATGRPATSATGVDAAA